MRSQYNFLGSVERQCERCMQVKHCMKLKSKKDGKFINMCRHCLIQKGINIGVDDENKQIERAGSKENT